MLEEGEGEPLVFVHGALGDYRTWEPQIAALAGEYRAISYSRRYHWESTAPGDGTDYSYPLHAEDLTALIKSLAAGPLHLVGHSYGGFVAAMVAQQQPELVHTLVLVEPATFGLLRDPAQRQSAKEGFGRAFAAALPLLEAGDREGAVRQFINFVRGDNSFDQLPETDRHRLVDNAHTLKLMTFNPVHRFGREEAQQIRARTLLVEGDKSPDFFRGTIAELAGCIPHATIATIGGAGHMSPRDNPQAFNRAIQNFLRE